MEAEKQLKEEFGDEEKDFKTKEDDVPCLCSQRWSLAIIGCFGFIFVYALRVNISVAMVCMVRTPLSNVTLTNDSYVNNTGDTHCVEEAQYDAIINDRAEFDWDKTLRSSMLASFFYGYIITQIPGGWLSDRFGGKRVFGITMLISAVATVLLPVCARTSYILVFVLRAILGLATGVAFPSVHSMWGRWSPPLERSKLTAVTYMGTSLGNIITFSTSGFLCQYGFDNGWGSIFYITGGLTFIWVGVWFYFTADSPSQNPRILDVEKKYIMSKIEYNTDVRTAAVPWRSMFTSSALWACLTAHVCNNWTNYTLLTSLPAFMKEVLKFDIKQNGALSSIPYICKLVSGFGISFIADYVRSKGFLTTTQTRKVVQVLSFLGMSCCAIITGFSSCETRVMAVVFLSLAEMFAGIARAGYICNHIDFAPKYGGILLGITNTAATIPGMIAPIVVGALTPNKSQEEWRKVFFVCAAVDVFGALVFGIFCKGEIEPWAKDEIPDKVEISLLEKNNKKT